MLPVTIWSTIRSRRAHGRGANGPYNVGNKQYVDTKFPSHVSHIHKHPIKQKYIFYVLRFHLAILTLSFLPLSVMTKNNICRHFDWVNNRLQVTAVEHET